MNKTCLIIAAATAVAASVSTTQAQPYYAAGANLLPDSWNAPNVPGSPQTLTGGPTVYSNTVLTTAASTIYEFKIAAGGWSSSWPGSNAKIISDGTSSNTFYFYPGTQTDSWLPLANRVGYADPGGLAPNVIGDFTSSPGWTAGIALDSLGNGLYSNSIVIATAGTYQFKFRLLNNWDISIGSDFGNTAGNISVTTTNSPQTVKFRLDLPNGRYLIGDVPPPPVTNYIVFSVDMSSQIQLGNFVPGTDSVFASGQFNGWPGTGPGALLLTNDPGSLTPNVYSGTGTNVAFTGTSSAYKFTCNNSAFNPVNGYETRTPDRSFVMQGAGATIVLPTVSFSDAYASDYLSTAALVRFSVDMSGAVGTDGHVFDPQNDKVYVNGPFAGWYAWHVTNPQNPESPAPSQYQMFESEVAGVYTNTVTIPAGTPISFNYKYGIATNPPNADLPSDIEAGFNNDHTRVVRNTGFSPYVFATDKFGTMLTEPFFNSGGYAGNTAGGQLTIGPASGGTTPVKWLGRPGAQLQTSTSLTGGWQTVPGTDGTNWISGTQSTNGFVSTTNWPTGGSNVFFRLIKP